jgi:hypothetical protein
MYETCLWICLIFIFIGCVQVVYWQGGVHNPWERALLVDGCQRYLGDLVIDSLLLELKGAVAKQQRSEAVPFVCLQQRLGSSLVCNSKSLARRHSEIWQPSGCTDAEQQFKNVQEAYTVLSDARKRHQYDSGADLEDDMDFDGFGGGGAYIF